MTLLEDEVEYEEYEDEDLISWWQNLYELVEYEEEDENEEE